MTRKIPSELTTGVKLAWAVGELPVAVYVVLTVGFLTFYATQALGIEPWLAGVVLLIPRLWDAFTDPLMGAMSDRTRSPMGRRRPYLLAGTFLLSVSVLAMFFAPAEASQMQKAVYLLVTFFIASTAITIYDVPYSSMAAEMSDDYNERTSLTGYKMFGARVGTLMVLFGVPALFTSRADLVSGFQLVGLVFGCFIILTGLIGVRFTRHAPRIEQTPAPFRFVSEFRAITSNKPFRILWLAFLFQNLAIGIAATMALYLNTMSLGVGPALLPIMMGATAAMAMLATPVWVWIGRRIGKRPSYLVALALAPISYLPMLFVPSGAFALILILFLIIGFSDAANQLFPNAMVPDTVEVDQLKTGERREGALFGAWAFCRKLGMTTGAFLASVLLSLTGFEPGLTQQPEAVLRGIREIYVLAPAVLWVCALLTLLAYRLTQDAFDITKAKIRASNLPSDDLADDRT